MEASEIKELSEKAKESNEKGVGLTTAIIAVLLAITTMLGHRTHTESVFLQSKANDQWAYYQAKNVRSHMYEALNKLALLSPNGKEAAQEFQKSSKEQKDSSQEILAKAQDLEKEANGASSRALKFDTAEIFLEIAIVLCSITLLIGNRAYWLTSLASTAIGIAFVVAGLLMHA